MDKKFTEICTLIDIFLCDIIETLSKQPTCPIFRCCDKRIYWDDFNAYVATEFYFLITNCNIGKTRYLV